jgi:hypothetical protein
LRIGFFTKRTIKANEELTFDYQFQTVGKMRQKCYCGSKKCRGFLGTSSSQSGDPTVGDLDHIWTTESDSESSRSSTPNNNVSDDENTTEQRPVSSMPTATSNHTSSNAKKQETKRDDGVSDI